VARLFN